MAHAVKFTLVLTDLAQFSTVNQIMSGSVPQPYPARSTVGVASLPKGALFEVELSSSCSGSTSWRNRAPPLRTLRGRRPDIPARLPGSVLRATGTMSSIAAAL